MSVDRRIAAGNDAGRKMTTKVRRFEFKDAKSNKFWEVKINGRDHEVRYGRIGTDGQSKTKTFADKAAASADAAKLIAQKTKKGYAEVTRARKKTPTKTTPTAKTTPKRFLMTKRLQKLQMGARPARTMTADTACALVAKYEDRNTTANWKSDTGTESSTLSVFDWQTLGDATQGAIVISNLFVLEQELPEFQDRYIPFAICGEGVPGGADDGVLLFDLWDGGGTSCAVILMSGSTTRLGRRIATSFDKLDLSIDDDDGDKPKTTSKPNKRIQVLSQNLRNQIVDDNPDFAEIKRLVEAGADIVGYWMKGARPLLSACEFGHKRIVTYLAEQGADLDITDSHGEGIEAYAKESDDPADMARFLKRLRKKHGDK